MNEAIKYVLSNGTPIIAAVKDEASLQRAVLSKCHNIFLLNTNICNVAELCATVCDAGKDAFVHVDLTTGLANKEVAADYIKQNTSARGIISTRPNLIKRAKSVGLVTVLRVFLLDSMALSNLNKQVISSGADMVEVLPGVMPKIICRICKECSVPVIAGGLILDSEDVESALAAGANMISTSWEGAWN